MSCRIQKGGWKYAPEEGFVDLINFHNYYLTKASASYPRVIVDQSAIPSGGNVTSSLIVIDMQKDFVDTDGAFSVADGVKMVPKLVNFINTYKSNFTKIIFTRDSHDAEHCSFKAFPPHCVINSPGGQLVTEMKYFAGVPNVDVIFKGMSPKTDSFGALNYPANNYAPTRQLADCGKHEGYLAETGGFYLKDKSKNFADQPFTGGNTYDAIRDELAPNKFKVADLFPQQKFGEHNVYIVGLAGDFCAKDTAMNIAKQAAKGPINGVKVNVFVIQPFVRYPFLPIFVPSPATDLNRFKTDEKNKPLYYYAFELMADGNKRLLKKCEIEKKDDEVIKNLFHFTTDPSDLLKDYTTAGVKMIMDIPTITTRTTTRQNNAERVVIARIRGPTRGGKRRCKKMRTRKQRRHRK